MTPDMRRNLYKWISISAFMFVCVIIQTTWLSKLRVFGASPSVIPYIVATIALLSGVGDGMIAGLVGGIMLDAIYSGYEGFYVITLTLLAFLICLMNTFMYWKNFSMSVFDWVLIVLVVNLLRYCFYMLLVGKGSILSVFCVVPGEIATTLPFTPFIFMIVRQILKNFEKSEDF